MNKFRMKQNVLQVVIPLVVVLLILPGDVLAKKATQLIIEKTDKKVIKGVLLHVDVDEQFLVLDADSAGIKIYMKEIDTIKVKQKSREGYAEKGLLIGIGVGVGFVSISTDKGHYLRGPFMLICGGFFGFVGLITGEIMESSEKSLRKIRVQGKFPKEIKKILKKLKKRALQ